MTVEDMVRRILRGHWVAIAVCVALPVLAVLVIQLRQAPEYVATVRLQVANRAPSTTTEAEALSSRVLALATTPALIEHALDDAHLDADSTARVGDAITVQRLGESSIVELSTHMSGTSDARALAVALAHRVADFMNEAGQKPFQARSAEVDEQLGAARRERDRVSSRLIALDSTSRSAPGLEAQLQRAQSSVDQLTQAKAQLAIAGSTLDRVVLVDGNRPEVAPVAATLLPRMALALLLGLLTGLVLAVLLETLRPRLPGARAVARRFDAPILGSTNQPLSAQINAMTLGARRQGLETVVILGVDPDSQRTSAWLLRRIERPGPTHSPAAKTRAPSYAATSEPDEHAPRGGGDEPELASLPTTVRFTNLASVSAAQEMSAGVVVVTSEAPLQSDVDIVEDLLRTTRWPIVGVLAEARGKGSVWA